MPTVAGRRNYHGKHRAAKSPRNGTPRLFAALVAGTLLTPVGLGLTTTATASAAAPSFGFRAKVQGYDSDGRAIIHYNNRIKDAGIENAVKHLNSTPGLNFVLKPGTGNGAINISNERFEGGVAGLGGWDNGGPFVKLDPKNQNFDPDDRTEIAAHELLHSIGLDHNDSGCSIMASSVNRCHSGPTPLSKNEIGQLNSMYQRGKADPNKPTSTTPDSTTKPGGPQDPGTGPTAQRPRPGQDSGDDEQGGPGPDSGDDWQSGPGQDSGDDWQSGPGEDAGDSSPSDPGDEFDWLGGDNSSDDGMFSDDGGNPFGDDFDWLGDNRTDESGDRFGSDVSDPSSSGDGFDWLGDGGDNPFGDTNQFSTGDLFGDSNQFGGDTGGFFDTGDLFTGGGNDDFDWFGKSGTDRFSGGDMFGDLAGAGSLF
ncbi:matrixin family metalloprotease [Nocardia sp. NPDC057030]|uniref:matrixin family metalloprotease n=1 Tax=unclassified Nocardia TaxID=2637762 RepID=UPI0036350EE0